MPCRQRPINSDMSDHWRARIANALQTAPAASLCLYAGDERRRYARRHQASVGRVRKAGVLIPIIAGATPCIVLTERSKSLRSHPGQISFPGGCVEPKDATAQAAALREAHEEVGLNPAHVKVLGRLPDYVTGTGFDIAPFAAWLPEDTRLVADNSEVARIFTVPLPYALDKANFRRETIIIKDQGYKFFVIEYAGNYIWGATAAMLYALGECVRQSSCDA